MKGGGFQLVFRSIEVMDGNASVEGVELLGRVGIPTKISMFWKQRFEKREGF